MSHYLRFTYSGIEFVAQMSYDAGPYIEVNHAAPCVGIGFNERRMAIRCAQTGRLESHGPRSFDLNGHDKPVRFWLATWSLNDDDLDEGEALVEYGRLLLGQGCADEECREAARAVSTGFHRPVYSDTSFGWWVPWKKRDAELAAWDDDPDT